LVYGRCQSDEIQVLPIESVISSLLSGSPKLVTGIFSLPTWRVSEAAFSKVSITLLGEAIKSPRTGISRTSGSTCGAKINARKAAPTHPAIANSELRFINPHYATAAATWLGGYGEAGYQYAGQAYSGRFFHARPVASCNSCHEPHTLEVQFEPCQTCHQADSPGAIRIARQSYDGSGNTTVGIRSDIQANAETLKEMILAYTDEVVGSPVIYDGSRYPYFFADANGDGAIDMAEGRPVAYANWTPRSLRTAFNWKLVTADPGNYAHNPQYSLELLYDSIADLSEPLGIDMEQLDLLR